MRMLRQFLRSQAGLAYLEFGLILPVLMLLFTGGYEMTRYIRLNQKLDKAANTIGDIVSQSQDISQAEIDQLLAAVDQLVAPFSLSANGYVIISSAGPGTTVPVVNWQYCGGGIATVPSHLGVDGGAATLPASISLGTSEDIIVAEVFYAYAPFMFDGIITANTVYKAAYFRPRLGALDDVTLTCD